MYRCLTCGEQKPKEVQIKGHVIRHHLPVDWTDEDLEQTSERVKDE